MPILTRRKPCTSPTVGGKRSRPRMTPRPVRQATRRRSTPATAVHPAVVAVVHRAGPGRSVVHRAGPVDPVAPAVVPGTPRHARVVVAVVVPGGVDRVVVPAAVVPRGV